MAKTYDCIVLGGGHNGLVAAALVLQQMHTEHAVLELGVDRVAGGGAGLAFDRGSLFRGPGCTGSVEEAHEELAVEVMPRQDDEFTCMSCFLVHHRSQLADEKKLICRDCI